MRRAYRSTLPGLIVLLVLIGLVAPPASARGEDPPGPECPEGLVYDAAGDICVLPENLPPAGEEPPVEEPAEEMPTEVPVDEGELPAEEEPVEEEPVDEAPVDEPAPAIAGDQDVPLGEFLTTTAAERGTIKNLTLLTFACPINWNPATRPIESSREMCTEPIVEAMNYTILFEGREWVTTAFGSDVDMAQDRQDQGPDAAPLPAGMYTIRENLQEGLDDPFAFCAIYAADGSTRLTVQETVPGGSLDILLAAGEEVNCEWYSVATVPEVAAPPSLGLEVKVFSCPAPAEFSGGLDDCTLPLPGPVTFEAIYDGQVMATGTLSSTEFPYEVDQEALSGEWTIRPILAEGWIDPHLTCWSVDYVGTYTGEITHFPPADGSLGVTVRLNTDQRAQCQIWLFAGDVRESVVVVTRDCPEAYDAATLSPSVRKATCPGSQYLPVSVTVDDAAPVEVDSTRNGVAVFPSEPGTWRIAVEPYEGRAVTFVTCDHTIAALGQVQTIEPTINEDRRSVSIDLDEGDALRCDSFFGPESAVAADAPAGGTGTDPTGDPTDDPAPAADTTAPDAETTDDPTDDPAPDAVDPANPTDPAADANENGSFGGGGEAVQVVDTGAQEAAAEGAPDSAGASGTGTSMLSIQHYVCEVPVADATTDDLVEICTASSEPSAWDLNGVPLDVADGYAVWEALESGTYIVGNAATDGKEDTASAVYCSIAPVDGVPLVAVEVPVSTGTIELVFDQPAVVYCAWFVAP